MSNFIQTDWFMFPSLTWHQQTFVLILAKFNDPECYPQLSGRLLVICVRWTEGPIFIFFVLLQLRFSRYFKISKLAFQEISPKSLTKFYLLCQILVLRRMKTFNLDIELIFDTYLKDIRSILELAVPVWHIGLTWKFARDIERVQKVASSLVRTTWTMK